MLVLVLAFAAWFQLGSSLDTLRLDFTTLPDPRPQWKFLQDAADSLDLQKQYGQSDTADFPGYRRQPAFCALTATRRLVMYGGVNGLRTTWVWDRDAAPTGEWTLLDDSLAPMWPPSKSNARFIPHEATQSCILVAGGSAVDMVDIWIYNEANMSAPWWAPYGDGHLQGSVPQRRSAPPLWPTKDKTGFHMWGSFRNPDWLTDPLYTVRLYEQNVVDGSFSLLHEDDMVWVNATTSNRPSCRYTPLCWTDYRGIRNHGWLYGGMVPGPTTRGDWLLLDFDTLTWEQIMTSTGQDIVSGSPSDTVTPGLRDYSFYGWLGWKHYAFLYGSDDFVYQNMFMFDVSQSDHSSTAPPSNRFGWSYLRIHPTDDLTGMPANYTVGTQYPGARGEQALVLMDIPDEERFEIYMFGGEEDFPNFLGDLWRISFDYGNGLSRCDGFSGIKNQSAVCTAVADQFCAGFEACFPKGTEQIGLSYYDPSYVLTGSENSLPYGVTSYSAGESPFLYFELHSFEYLCRAGDGETFQICLYDGLDIPVYCESIVASCGSVVRVDVSATIRHYPGPDLRTVIALPLASTLTFDTYDITPYSFTGYAYDVEGYDASVAPASWPINSVFNTVPHVVWNFANWEPYFCLGTVALDLGVCGGADHGTCQPSGQCLCLPDYGTPASGCVTPRCYGELAGTAAACSDNGDCNANFTCDCDAGYTDSECETQIQCGGVFMLDNGACNGHGNCSVDGCDCEDGYDLPLCTEASTPFTLPLEAIIGIAAGGGALLIVFFLLLLLVCMCCCIRCKKKNQDKGPGPTKADELEEFSDSLDV